MPAANGEAEQVSARDNVDNQSLSSATYAVGYRICLLYDPAKPQPIGGTVVIKLQLCYSSGANLSASRFAVRALTIDRLYTPPPNQGSSNLDQLFRYDAKLKGKNRFAFAQGAGLPANVTPLVPRASRAT